MRAARRRSVRAGTTAAVVSAAVLLSVDCDQQPGVRRQHVPVSWQYVGGSGRVLVIAVGGDSCTTGDVRVRASEREHEVSVVAVSHERVVGACGGEGFLQKEVLALAAPLGPRHLTGCRQPVADCRTAEADVPAWRPTSTSTPSSTSPSTAP